MPRQRKPSARKRSSEPLELAVKALLGDKGRSLRSLAADVGVDVAHLSRAIRYSASKAPTADLLARIAAALDVSPDYFAEVRQAVAERALREDPRLRDEIYDGLPRAKKRQWLAEFLDRER